MARAVGGALLLATVACGAPETRGAPAATRRPNIVFVLLDDVRYDDLVDHPFARFPAVERLRREGASFRRAFTSAPLCSPSRAVFLTGQYPLRGAEPPPGHLPAPAA
jgi:hypothetical protein